MPWFALRVAGIIPVVRGGDLTQQDPLADCAQTLAEGKTLILFPEGTRGEPEQLSELKTGLWYLSQQFPDVPITPVFICGLGRAMGKNQWLPVPFFIDIYVDKPLFFSGDKPSFTLELTQRFNALQQRTTHKNKDL